jgi:hypothetical protein
LKRHVANTLMALHGANEGLSDPPALARGPGVGLDVGRDPVAGQIEIARTTGAVRGRYQTLATRREHGPRHPDVVKLGWKAPTARSVVECRRGFWADSYTSTASTRTPAAFWAGGPTSGEERGFSAHSA